VCSGRKLDKKRKRGSWVAIEGPRFESLWLTLWVLFALRIIDWSTIRERTLSKYKKTKINTGKGRKGEKKRV
jgi:hypothetical protein